MSGETLTIDRLGTHGDGIAETEKGPVYVPFTLPRETATVAREGETGTLIALTQAAPERAEPPCPHFGPDGEGGACGGCNLQHLETDAYRVWKREQVVRPLAMNGIETEIAPLYPCEPGARRRMVLTARRTENGMLVGFNQAGSHNIVPIIGCLVGDPRIVKHLASVRRIARAVCATRKPFRLTVFASETGLDIAAEGAGRVSTRQRQMAIETALSMKVLARLTVDGETLVEARQPIVRFGGISVVPPPGAFLQASAAAEDRMADLVLGHLAGAKRIADLFAGCGAFALRLAREAAVITAESEGPALAALDAAARHATGLKPVEIDRRDLFRRPLMAADLKYTEAVVFDPPRAGAEAQAHQLAASKVCRVAAVSCNPATLARDLAILVEGGFAIDAVHPIDQFLWSPHVEAVALLTRR
ncbi:class I SAM-dependent RNA methyltransferase [Pararhizobium mangrovi]|uniref:Class I SAM-dependent RNA methyltransferase n=1 Tax=Pararhizobium mangrovi TaxID=2590452 RepID=A0A506TVW0_9HYPH|nr:class I SAM-dependent RNA methyltransferase [Pararhizobium mangrovi]TPW26213.1 class I SAM-dependent RNA methyltransferase [Pararhizobium mangrovi]